jgi:hypothetical protein
VGEAMKAPIGELRLWLRDRCNRQPDSIPVRDVFLMLNGAIDDQCQALLDSVANHYPHSRERLLVLDLVSNLRGKR